MRRLNGPERTLLGLIRNICCFVLLVACALAPLFLQGASAAAGKNEYIVYIGTYTRKASKGIYAYRFNPAAAELTPIGLVAETVSPSWLALHPGQRYLYAANEISKYEGKPGGSISAYALDAKTGNLTFINKVSSRGDGPCHLMVDATGKCLLAANYGGGSIAAFPVAANGSLGEASAFVQHTGSPGPNSRQKTTHAHATNISPDNRFVLVPDLGLDKVLVYRLAPAAGTVTPNDPPFAQIAPGSGPRHLAFHPNGRFVYVINELLSTVTAFAYDRNRGSLKEVQTVSTLPQGFDGRNNTAEVAVHPNGRFLYGSNRGHDSIALFTVDPRKGSLTLVEQVPTQGKTPRNFAIDPTGAYLFAANQDTDNIVLFRIDPKTGRLSPAGKVLEVGAPVSVVFVPAQAP